MAITDVLNDAKKMLHDIMRKRKFKKANLDRAERAELTAELAKCCGKINACKTNFRSAIREQHRHIAEGRRMGYDTIPQEQIMWDAALGYMLVEDAEFALKSLASYDSMTRAYSMLDQAMLHMTGKKSKLGKKRLAADSDRDGFGYLNSEEVQAEKEELLDSFFEQLKVSGDIEACLKAAKNPTIAEGDRRTAYVTGNTAAPAAGDRFSQLSSMLDQMDSAEDENLDCGALADSAMIDTRPPHTEGGM